METLAERQKLLEALGFEPVLVARALMVTNASIDAAIEWIFAETDRRTAQALAAAEHKAEYPPEQPQPSSDGNLDFSRLNLAPTGPPDRQSSTDQVLSVVQDLEQRERAEAKRRALEEVIKQSKTIC